MGKKIAAALLAFLFMATIGGCSKEGPAERAGKKFDNMLDKAKEKVEDVTK